MRSGYLIARGRPLSRAVVVRELVEMAAFVERLAKADAALGLSSDLTRHNVACDALKLVALVPGVGHAR